MFLFYLHFNFVSSDSSSVNCGCQKSKFKIHVSLPFSWKFRNCRNSAVNLFPHQNYLIYAVVAAFFSSLEIQGLECEYFVDIIS